MPATLDPLTWLPTDDLFRARLALAVDHLHASPRGLALLHIDLDGFAEVNDTFGAGLADRILREAAERIARLPRSVLALGRLGGDDFALLIRAADLGAAGKRAAELLDELRRPYVLACVSVVVTASIGIALWPAHATDAAGLMEAADRALHRAKIAGRNCVYPASGKGSENEVRAEHDRDRGLGERR